MATTIVDMVHFTEAPLSHKILRPATRRQMFTPQFAIDTAHQFPGLPTEPSTSAEGPAAGLSYGTGWGLLARTKYGPAFFKEGTGNGVEN